MGSVIADATTSNVIVRPFVSIGEKEGTGTIMLINKAKEPSTANITLKNHKFKDGTYDAYVVRGANNSEYDIGYVYEKTNSFTLNGDSINVTLNPLSVTYLKIGANGEYIPLSAPRKDGTAAEPSMPDLTLAADGSITVLINGKKIEFDVKPVLKEGRTLVPLRKIFEELGMTVEWDDPTQTVTATKPGTIIVLPIGSTEPTVNGNVVPIDVPGELIEGRTLVPVRFVAEATGATVGWDDPSQTVIIETTHTLPLV